MRRALEQQFRTLLKVLIGEDDIIENVRPRGYRLNPYLVRLSIWQIDASIDSQTLEMPQLRTRRAANRDDAPLK
jgi:hypothetical protein